MFKNKNEKKRKKKKNKQTLYEKSSKYLWFKKFELEKNEQTIIIKEFSALYFFVNRNDCMTGIKKDKAINIINQF